MCIWEGGSDDDGGSGGGVVCGGERGLDPHCDQRPPNCTGSLLSLHIRHS